MIRGAEGFFLTLEGGDGVGKSTLQRLLNQRIVDAGYDVVMCREPGGTALGEKLRSALLGSKKNEVDPLAELLIFLSARAQLSAEIIKPALKRGAIVICDRFTDSSIAYQHYGRGIKKSIVEDLNAIATEGLTPDRTILLDLDPAIGSMRNVQAQDYMEQETINFHNRVREGYLSLAKEFTERWLIVDALQEEGIIVDLVWTDLKKRIRG
ncbi:MAG: dTMP kinase [Chloroflexi bacterium]|mgnify:FL=1|nr:dTMP kinase [Chloroflexota bacterium]|tara:strand:+ start:6860 stop:7489 length:630 start_codon:yes stop_codon:yes gene_type:complete